MEGFLAIFQEVDDPRESNAKMLGRYAGGRLADDAVGPVVMQLVRPVREVQMGVSEPILGP